MKYFSMKRFLLTALIIVCTCLCVLPAAAITDANTDSDKYKITLQEAIDMALAGNIELQEQRKNLGISQNDIKTATALKNPQFQSNFLMGRIAKTNSSQFGLTLPVEITKRGARKKVSEAGLSYTENKIKDSEFKLKLKIRIAYFNLLVAKSNLKLMEDRKDLLEDLYDIAKNRPKNNDSYTIDLLQADMKLKKQLIQINRAEANVKTAQYNFNRVLNLENNLTLYDSKDDSLFNQPMLIANANLPSYETLENTAFQNRYDIKMSQAKILKAQRNISVVTKQRIPDVYVSGGYAFAHDGTPGAFVGAGFEIPSLYLYTPEIKTAKLEYDKAQLEYNSIINITKNIIHTNYDKFIIAQDNVQHYKDIINKSNEILKLSKQRYKKGKATLTSLIVVEQSHQDVLQEYMSALGVYYNSYIELLQEIGTDNLVQAQDL